MDDDTDGYGHEDVLQALVRHLFTSDAADLDDVCADAGLPTLLDADGVPVRVSAAHTYHEAGVLTMNRGVLLDLSDGSQFGLTVTVARRPHENWSLRYPRD